MKCPCCGNEMQKGVVRITTAGNLTNSLTMVNWYSDEQNTKKFLKKGIELQLNADGCYCDECMKVFAGFEEK